MDTAISNNKNKGTCALILCLTYASIYLQPIGDVVWKNQEWYSLQNICFAIALFLLSTLFLKRCFSGMTFSILELLWLPVTLLVLLRNHDFQYGNIAAALLIPIGILYMLMSIHDTTFYENIITTAKVFTFIHIFATVVFWLFPYLYNTFWLPRVSVLTDRDYYSTLFASNVAGYMNGFATHYSTQGIYVSAGVLAFSTFVCDKKKRVRDIILFAFAIFALILVTKRAHLLFSVLAIIGGIFFTRKKATYNKIANMLAVTVIIIFITFFAILSIPDLSIVFERYIGIFEDPNVLARFDLWNLSIALWTENPLFGIGWNGFKYYTGIEAGRVFTGIDPHNAYIQLLAEVGLIGTILIVFVMFRTLYMTIYYFTMRRHGLIDIDEKHEKLLFYSLICQLFFLLYCLTGGTMSWYLCFYPYVFACGITYSYKRIQNKCKNIHGYHDIVLNREVVQ